MDVEIQENIYVFLHVYYSVPGFERTILFADSACRSISKGAKEKFERGKFGFVPVRGRSEVRNLLFEPNPELSPKLWVIAARLENPRPWAKILQRAV